MSAHHKRNSGWNKPEIWHRQRLLDNLIKWQKQNGRCFYCRIPMTISHPKSQPKNRDFTIEHLLPVSQGGDDSINNTPLCCSKCNNRRGNDPLEEFVNSDWLFKKITMTFNQKDEYQPLPTQTVYVQMYEKYQHSVNCMRDKRYGKATNQRPVQNASIPA